MQQLISSGKRVPTSEYASLLWPQIRNPCCSFIGTFLYKILSLLKVLLLVLKGIINCDQRDNFGGDFLVSTCTWIIYTHIRFLHWYNHSKKSPTGNNIWTPVELDVETFFIKHTLCTSIPSEHKKIFSMFNRRRRSRSRSRSRGKRSRSRSRRRRSSSRGRRDRQEFISCILNNYWGQIFVTCIDTFLNGCSYGKIEP